MITRRELAVAAIAALTTLAAVTWAQAPAKPALKSAVYDLSKIQWQPTNYGSKCGLFSGRTTMLDMLESHMTTINPGEATHPPEPQTEEELVIVKEGTVETQVTGEPQQVGAGSVIFAASGDLHGVKNVGDTPATYYVIRWSVDKRSTGSK